MNDLSELLKEAKPLYFEKKRQRQRVQRALMSCAMVLTVGLSMCGGYMLRGDSVTIANVDDTAIESYFPLDDYGLITVMY